MLGKSRVAEPILTAASAKPGEAATESLRNLELPRAVQTSIKPSAADVGSATHLVLQHLDFNQPCDAANLQSQLDLLVDRRLIAPAAAKSVDLEALCWLRDSSVGRMLRDKANDVRRELPLYLAIDPDEFDPAATSTTPEDRVMVRSRVDALVRTKRGYEIVDYKTDHVTADTLAARVESYRPQMSLYRRAIEAITGQPVAAVHLVFLSIREIITVR